MSLVVFNFRPFASLPLLERDLWHFLQPSSLELVDGSGLRYGT